jgi:hypothetical protein
MFITTPDFLPQYHQQVPQIISAAEARGQDRLAEMNRQVVGNLAKIITALEAEALRIQRRKTMRPDSTTR